MHYRTWSQKYGLPRSFRASRTRPDSKQSPVRSPFAYQLTEMSENLRSKARADIEAALAKDVFALVDYWCVDDQYDGKIFCARHFAARVKGKLELSLSWEAEAQSRQAAMMVKAVDVFGNTAFYALQEAEPCSI